MIIRNDGMIEIKITSDMFERAKIKAEEMGELKNSIRKGRGNLAGFLGEEIVLEAFPGSVSNNNYDYDIALDEMKLEIKTKDRTVEPKLSYEASVANYNTRQAADFYVFVSLYRDKASDTYTHGYVVGLIEKDQYKQRAKYLKAGDVDPSNNWIVSADCYNLPYKELTRFGEIVEAEEQASN